MHTNLHAKPPGFTLSAQGLETRKHPRTAKKYSTNGAIVRLFFGALPTIIHLGYHQLMAY